LYWNVPADIHFCTGIPLLVPQWQKKVTKWNMAMEKIVGRKKSDVIGKDFVSNFIKEEHKTKIKEFLQGALEGENVLY
jgi:PAS domain S-box-containing protein